MSTPSPNNRTVWYNIIKYRSQNALHASPPPAYTLPPPPPPTLSLQQMTDLSLRQVERQREERPVEASTTGRPMAMDVLPDLEDPETSSDDDDDGDDEEPHSPICLRINTSVNVTQSNNLICLTESPANYAKMIAQAVVHAMKESSAARSGIPMIDEHGRPRPVRIEVDAGMMVEGAGNIIGSPSVVDEVLRQRTLRRARESENSDTSAGGSGGGSGGGSSANDGTANPSPFKRRRSGP